MKVKLTQESGCVRINDDKHNQRRNKVVKRMEASEVSILYAN